VTKYIHVLLAAILMTAFTYCIWDDLWRNCTNANGVANPLPLVLVQLCISMYGWYIASLVVLSYKDDCWHAEDNKFHTYMFLTAPVINLFAFPALIFGSIYLGLRSLLEKGIE
jgi:hypothetical protein